jgi:hypothetical protein
MINAIPAQMTRMMGHRNNVPFRFKVESKGPAR